MDRQWTTSAIATGFAQLRDLIPRLPWPAFWGLTVLIIAPVGSCLPGLLDILTPGQWGRLAALVPLLGFLLPRQPRRLLWILVASAAFMVGSSASYQASMRPLVSMEDPDGPSRWRESGGVAVVRLTARPRAGQSERWSAPASFLAWHPDGDTAHQSPSIGDGIMLRGKGSPPEAGAILGGFITIRTPNRASIKGGFHEGNWLGGRGIAWTGRVPADAPMKEVEQPADFFRWWGDVQSSLQGHLRQELAKGLPLREASLAASVLLGGGSERYLREPFARLGLAHLFALSGLHVGILVGLVLLLLKPLKLPLGGRLLVLTLLLGMYAALVDLPGSVVRAVGLVLLSLLVQAMGRRRDGLRILGLLLWINVLWRPACLLDTGVRLSYLAAGGILGGQRLITLVMANRGRLPRQAASTVGVAVSAQLATIPVTAESFGFLPLAGPLFNLVAVPIFGAAAMLLASGLLLIQALPWAGEGLLAVSWLILRPLAAITSVVGGAAGLLEVGLPVWGPGRLVLYLIMILALGNLLRYRRWLPAAATYVLILFAASYNPGPARPEAWQFAVDQGDCALLRLPDGWTVMVDTGPRWMGGGSPLARDVAPWLRRRRIRRLDAVVLTHGHDDHTGGSVDLSTMVDVDRWYTGGRARSPAMAETMSGLVDTLHRVGEWSVLLFNPLRETGHDENDASLSLGLCRHDSLMGLWTGDLEKSGEIALLPFLPPVPATGLPFWKAGHHGSITSGSPRFLDFLHPRIVGISCGVANRHHHPSHGPFPGARVLRTDRDGTISLSWNRSSMPSVSTARSPSP